MRFMKFFWVQNLYSTSWSHFQGIPHNIQFIWDGGLYILEGIILRDLKNSRKTRSKGKKKKERKINLLIRHSIYIYLYIWLCIIFLNVRGMTQLFLVLSIILHLGWLLEHAYLLSNILVFLFLSPDGIVLGHIQLRHWLTYSALLVIEI